MRQASARSCFRRPARPMAYPTACRSARARRSVRSIPMAKPSSRSSGHCTGMGRPMGCARRRCAISTLPEPIPRAKSANAMSPKPTSCHWCSGSTRPEAANRHLRHRLPDAGRDGNSRLRPCQRSCHCPSACTRAPARRRRQHCCQSRHRPRSFGARGNRCCRERSAAATSRLRPHRGGQVIPPALVADPSLAAKILGWRAQYFGPRYDHPNVTRLAYAHHSTD